jgi:hypothetical protein
MNAVSQIALTPDLTARASQYLRAVMKQNPQVESVALCALNGTCIWASDRAFERLAPSIGRIGIASLRLWAKVRTGRVERVGLVTSDGTVDIVFVPPLASLLVVSLRPGGSGWPDGEPERLMQAMNL